MLADVFTGPSEAVIGVALRIGLTLVLAWLVIRAVVLFAHRTEARLDQRGLDAGRRARLQTLIDMGVGTARAIVFVLAGLMVLHTLDIDITPVLAGVSVAGLAVSLGAQALIRDFIGGLLILTEDQFHTGDVIQVGTVTGTVEDITLRATRVRDDEGKLWVIPNGEVRIVSNFTRDWARAVVDITIPATGDTERVVAELKEALLGMQANPEVTGLLLEPPEVLNWNSLTDTAVQVRLLAKTSPGKQWEVARAMRRYATLALQQASAGAAEVATGAQPAAGDQPAPVEQTASDDGPAPQSEAADPARAQPRETRS